MAFTAAGISNSNGGTGVSFTPSAAGTLTGSNNVVLLGVIVNSLTAIVTPPAGWSTLFTYNCVGAMAGKKVWYFWRREAALTTLNWGAFSINVSSSYFWMLTTWKDAYPTTFVNEAITTSGNNLTVSGGNRITRASGTFSAAWIVGTKVRLENFSGGLAAVNGDYRISAVDSGAHLYVEFRTEAGANPAFPAGVESTGIVKFLVEPDLHPFGITSNVVYAITEEYHRNVGEATKHWPSVTTQGYTILLAQAFNTSAISPTTAPDGSNPSFLVPAIHTYPGNFAAGGFRSWGYYSDDQATIVASGARTSPVSGYNTGEAGVNIMLAVHKTQPPAASTNLTASCLYGGIPFAAFEYSPTGEIVQGSTVTFTDLSDNAPTSWLWSFGDGDTSTAQNPTHVYAEPGVYRVTMSATNSIGTSFVASEYITVVSSSATASFMLPPVAAFTLNKAHAEPDETITFTNASAGTNLTYLWEFGDGTTSASASPTHSYQNAGRYRVKLTVTDPSMLTAESVVEVFIEAGIDASFAAPVGTITITNNREYHPVAMTFAASVKGYSPVSYLWSFGDGETSTDESPSHEYAASGKYVVTLMLTNIYGTTTTKMTAVAVCPVQIVTIPNRVNVALFLEWGYGHAYDGSWSFKHQFSKRPNKSTDDPGELHTPRNIAIIRPL